MVPEVEKILLEKEGTSARCLSGGRFVFRARSGPASIPTHINSFVAWIWAELSSHAFLIRNCNDALFFANSSAILETLPDWEQTEARRLNAVGVSSSGHVLQVKLIRLLKGLNLLNDSDAHNLTESTLSAVIIRITAEQACASSEFTHNTDVKRSRALLLLQYATNFSLAEFALRGT